MTEKEGKMKVIRCFFIVLIIFGLSAVVYAGPRETAASMILQSESIVVIDSDMDGVQDSIDVDKDGDGICDAAGFTSTTTSDGGPCTPCSQHTTDTVSCPVASEGDNWDNIHLALFSQLTEQIPAPSIQKTGCYYKFGLGYLSAWNEGVATINFDLGPNAIDWFGGTELSSLSSLNQSNIDSLYCRATGPLAVFGQDETTPPPTKYVPDLTGGPGANPNINFFSLNDSNGNSLCPSAVSKEGFYFLFGKFNDTRVINTSGNSFESKTYFPNVGISTNPQMWTYNWIFGGPTNLTKIPQPNPQNVVLNGQPQTIQAQWHEGQQYLYYVNWDNNINDCLCLNSDKTRKIVKQINTTTPYTGCIDRTIDQGGIGYWGSANLALCRGICSSQGFGNAQFIGCTDDSEGSYNLETLITVNQAPADQPLNGTNVLCLCDNVWNIGGEAQNTTPGAVDNCCGDDKDANGIPTEYAINSLITGYTADFAACCDNETDCAFNNKCYNSYSTLPQESEIFLAGKLHFCKDAHWKTADDDPTVCADMHVGNVIGDPTPGNFECCGDDPAIISYLEDGGFEEWTDPYPAYPAGPLITTPKDNHAVWNSDVLHKTTDSISGSAFALNISQNGPFATTLTYLYLDDATAGIEKDTEYTIQFWAKAKNLQINVIDVLNNMGVAKISSPTWTLYTAKIKSQINKQRIQIQFNGSQGAEVVIDNMSITKQNQNYDSGKIRTTTITQMLCVDCTFNNCPDGLNNNNWHVQPAGQSFYIHTIDRDLIGQEKYDILSNGKEWNQCNTINLFQNLPPPAGGNTFTNTCTRPGVDGCICPHGCELAGAEFRPGHFEDCGCHPLEKPDICKISSSVPCVDAITVDATGTITSQPDGICDDCQGGTTFTDTNGGGDTRRGVLVLKSSCTNEDNSQCMTHITISTKITRSVDENCSLAGGTFDNCDKANGNLCIGGEWVTTKEIGGARPDNCCVGGYCANPSNLLCEKDLKGSLSDISIWTCPQEHIIKSSDTTTQLVCCDSITNRVLNNDEIVGTFDYTKDLGKSFICYNEGYNIWAECCYGTNCMNSFRQQGDFRDKNVFGPGGMLYALNTFDTYTTQFQDNIKAFKNIASGDKVGISAALVDRAKEDWSNFDNLELDIMTNTQPGRIEIINESNDMIWSYDTPMNYSINGQIEFKWHHLVIPLSNQVKNNKRINVIYIVSKTAGTTIAVDNIFLSKTNTKNHYCAGSFKIWVNDTEPPENYWTDPTSAGLYNVFGDEKTENDYLPYMEVCNAQASFQWTGTKCCGDDNTYTEAAGKGENEYYTDTLAACWKGYTIPNEKRVSDILPGLFNQKIVYESPNYYGCNYKYSNTKDIYDNSINISNLQTLTIQKAQFCNTTKNYFCAYNGSVWKNITINEDGQTIGIRNTTSNVPTGLTQNYPTECCPMNMCWNGSLCVGTSESLNKLTTYPSDANYVCHINETSGAADWVQCTGPETYTIDLANRKAGYCAILTDANVFCDYDNYWKPANKNGYYANGDIIGTRNNSKSIAWPASGNITSCCPIDKCWNGNKCVNSTEPGTVINDSYFNSHTESFSTNFGAETVYICMHQPPTDTQLENASWKLIYKKKRWDDLMNGGYCENQTQCWTGIECVNTTWYTDKNTKPSVEDNVNYKLNLIFQTSLKTGDRYCDAGNWSSRTKLVAIALLNYTKSLSPPVDYTIFCDTYNNTLNNYPELATYMADGTNSNNFCVLKYDAAGTYKVWFGTSLNSEITEPEHQPLLDRLGATGILSCTDQENEFFNDCGVNKKLYYNNKYNLVVFTEEGETFNPTIIDNFIANPFRTIADIIISFVNPSSPQVKTASYIKETKDFNTYYQSFTSGSLKITGTKEIIFNKTNTASNYITPYKTLQVTYYNTTADICNNVAGMYCNTTTTTTTQDICTMKNPFTGGCASWGTIATTSTNATIYYAQSITNTATIDSYWKELTAKTR